MSPIRRAVGIKQSQQPKGAQMECTVPLSVCLATEHADVGSLERTVGAALSEVGARLWVELLGRLEVALATPVTCASCGAPMKANGRAPRRLVTLVGEVEIRRRRYRCTACGAEVVPLDTALGLEPRTQHTLGVRERGLWLVTEMSYQKAVEVASELRRWRIGRGELHHWVAHAGPMEKAVDIVIARSFKARGMSWFRRGVSALVRLRLLRLNGIWTRYWSERFVAALRPWTSPA